MRSLRPLKGGSLSKIDHGDGNISQRFGYLVAR